VTRDHLDAFLDDCPALGIRGLSVTIPHKEAVLKRLGKADGAVKGIGAANTILWEGSDTIGYNTDYRAAMECIDQATGGSEANEQHLKGKTALMLGAGGVSKAVVFGLKRRGADVVIANRHRERAEALAGALDARVVDWDKRHTVEPHIIVNGTPVGMHPNVNESPFNKNYFESDMTVFDTVYNPEQTLLLKEAKAAGCKIVTGTEMFVRQAGLQFKLFTGQEPPLETMREALKRAIGPAKY
jgi:3-dehydroquinate dehydratase/shikimate dehydrogenase